MTILVTIIEQVVKGKCIHTAGEGACLHPPASFWSLPHLPVQSHFFPEVAFDLPCAGGLGGCHESGRKI